LKISRRCRLDIRKIEHVLLISFCALIIIPLLYIGRSVDTNTFTSWRWVFSETGILRVFFLLVPAILCAYALSRLPFSGPYAYAFLFVLSLASVLPLWIEPESVIDASRYFLQAKSLKEYGVLYFLKEWGNAIPAWTDMPLVSFLYGLVFSWAGETRMYIQALNSLFFALTALLTSLIGKKLWDEETGLHAGILLMGVPYLLTQVPLMLVDVPTMFFLTLSIYLFLQAIEQGGILRTAAAALATTLAVFSKYSTWPMLFITPLISIVRMNGEPKKIVARAFAVLLMTGVLAGAVISVRFDFFREQTMLLRTYQWSGLSRWQDGFVSTFLFQTHPFITGLALYGIYRAVREKDRRFLVAGWFMCIVVLLQIKRIRYIIPLLPLFVLMASYGLNEIRDKGIRRFISLSIVASSLVIAYSAFLPFLKSTSMANLKQAGQYLDTLNCSSVEVHALPQKGSSGSTFAVIPILDYHTDRKIVCPQEWPTHPEDGTTRTSSMRFTWEMKKPGFYSQPAMENSCAVVLISDEALDRVPTGLSGRELKRFDLTSDVFRYQTVVTIYRKN
jgi:hypothetical protein